MNKHDFSKIHLELQPDKKSYFIKDAVHQEIDFAPDQLWLYQLVNTPELQRLAKIYQLSLSHNNFPTATHTRFSHSLGTYQVCNQIIKHFLTSNQLESDQATQIQINIALAAALLHDIGHGPHSHAFERYLHFNHEVIAQKILFEPNSQVHQILVNKALADHLPANYYVQHISQIINKKNAHVELNWVQSLISSQIDCDRLDYLLRDSYFSGLNYGKLDYRLLIKWMRISKHQWIRETNSTKKINQIVFLDKAQFLITNFLNARVAMYSELYENAYAAGYESLVGLMLNRFQQLILANKEQRLWKRYQFLYELITPYFYPDQFIYHHFLNLTDESFNVLLSTFMEADDSVLQSLANLFHGRIKASFHMFMLVSHAQVQAWTNFVKNNAPANWLLADFYPITPHPITFYQPNEPILMLDTNSMQVCDYWAYVAQYGYKPENKIITRPSYQQLVIVSQSFLKATK